MQVTGCVGVTRSVTDCTRTHRTGSDSVLDGLHGITPERQDGGAQRTRKELLPVTGCPSSDRIFQAITY